MQRTGPGFSSGFASRLRGARLRVLRGVRDG
jgi:hypothetical protein